MPAKLILVATILASLSTIAQGDKVGGLKLGFWQEKTEDNHNFTKTGTYKIISLSKYDTICKLIEGCYRIKYKGHTQILLFSGQQDDHISVKDGIWKTHDDKGNLVEEADWTDGLIHSIRQFDETGNLLQYRYTDYENDTSFLLTYIDGQLFKKTISLPDNKNQQINVYYPNDLLTISNAELTFEINFLNKPNDTQDIILKTSKEVTLTSIASNLDFVRVTKPNKKPVTFPLTIKANASVLLKIIVSPNSTNYQMVDTLSLFVAEREVPFRIYSTIYASHIDKSNISKLRSIQLSRTKDKYLILSSMGSVTGATITSRDDKNYYYEINGATKIDLSVFHAGAYRLSVASCNTSGQLNFEIKD